MKLKIRTRNFSCKSLGTIDTGKKKVVLRFGSITPTDRIFKNSNNVMEINSVEGCKNSSDKRIMKELFINNEVLTAQPAIILNKYEDIKEVEEAIIDIFDNGVDILYPLIAKKYNSSKGNNIFYIENDKDLENFLLGHEKDFADYIIEKYYSYNREYRLHVTNEGCFYTCRKMLKKNAEVRWHRHENNCVWVVEDNPLFDKPSNWESIVDTCIKAKNAVGLDICAVDVKVQSSKYKEPKFIILETNSAPALGDIGIEKYRNLLLKMIQTL